MNEDGKELEVIEGLRNLVEIEEDKLGFENGIWISIYLLFVFLK
jgi:hypothetical protein